MSKVLIGVFTGIFLGAVIYELVNRTNPELVQKLQDLASRKVDELCGDQPAAAAPNEAA